MIRPPPRFTRTATRFPDPTHFRSNLTASTEHNVDALGTANIKLYSPEERAALAIMRGNMEQLRGQVEDEPGPLIKAVLARLDTALRAYDLFIARSDSCPPA